MARLPAMVSPRAGAAGAQRCGGHGDRAGRARRRRALPLGDAVHGRGAAARKLVLATGQDGTGEWWMPDFVRALPADRRAHTCEMIDFERLRGHTVAVLGAGASAMDNAAVALEHGAADVHLFCRRAEPSVVQRYRWLTFAGFMRHIGEMPDEWRWRVMGNILKAREGFPGDTYKRVLAFANFTMHVGRPWTDARMADGRIRIDTPRGPFPADYVICGTGIRQNVTLRPELASFADNDRTVERSLHAAAGRGGSAAGGLSLSRAGLRLPRTLARRGAVARRHPPVRHRRDAELRALGQQHQRHDLGGCPRSWRA